MDGINFIQDLAIVLLFAGFAGVLCKRIGLSVIVGYLLAGILIGPYTPPFSFIGDVGRIQVLSQVGLVFLMFAIGLGLSLTKLGRMGLPALLATGLGAFFVLNLTQILGLAAGWSATQVMFIASMFMVSSSAVIAKIVGELKLTHEGTAQRALGITVMEDVVAVVMLTILSSRSLGAEANVGSMLATMSAFVVLLVGAGLLLVPRLFRRLETKADPELRTIIIAGLLFLLAISAAKAGYSMALGAFLLGAIVAEMPQKVRVEKAFAGMRDVFSSVFFVSIGMMIDVKLLLHVWPWIIGLFVFVMVARPLAMSAAMILCGTPPREARQASLLLTPLGEFSFIIAQLGVSTGVLEAKFYPLAVGVSILTVLVAPLVNRNAAAISNVIERIEPRWMGRALEAYGEWLRVIQARQSAPRIWRFIKGRVFQIAVEMLVITGLMLFSPQLLLAIQNVVDPLWVEGVMLGYLFWGGIGLVVLILLLAIWRNITTIGMIVSEHLGTMGRYSIGMGGRAMAAVVLGYWLYLILPVHSLPVWGWGVIASAALMVVAFSSKRLIYWHSSWQSSVQDVFTTGEASVSEVRDSARAAIGQGLESWGLRLEDYIVPDDAAYAGHNLEQLAIPTYFGCSVIEVERNGHVITSTGPDLRIYPGDKLMLLGAEEALMAARAFLKKTKGKRAEEPDAFDGSILETLAVHDGPRMGKTLASLLIARETGTRIVGIQRGSERIINPDGNETLEVGDSLLVVGTLSELRTFRRWLKGDVDVTSTSVVADAR